VLELFTEHGRQAVAMAQDEARELHAQQVGVEHLLLAILQVDGGQIAHDVLGVSAAQVREALATDTSAASREPAEPIPFTPNARRVMNAAVQETHSLGEYVDASHLLAHILATTDLVIDRVLAALNVDRDQACRRAQNLISAQRRGRAAHASPSTPQMPTTTEDLIRRMVHRQDALIAALRRYGRHDNDCPAPSAPCTCGLSTALVGTDDDQ
jgi:ATP-dependent Clp protease ATP-binding subunit ClpA